jgi:hypothetical protein
VPFRLVNENNPDLTLSLTSDTWFEILDLAEVYGWNPMGTAIPGKWDNLEAALAGYYPDSPVRFNGGHDPKGRLVLLEDALNLADALDSAFMEYEPVRVPASFFLFAPRDGGADLRVSIGALQAVTDFCRYGAFWIERYYRPS